MVKQLTSLESAQEIQDHQKEFGDFNQAPPGFREITESEFNKGGFFTWCKEKVEFRQIVPESIPAGALLTPTKYILAVTLFYMNHGSHYGMARGEEGVRYFTFAKCHHDYQEISQEEARKAGVEHFGNCYHVCQCVNCGHISAYDSSD